MVKPEEVCLIDTMQVGSKRLEDAGYAAVDKDDDDRDDDDVKEHILEQDLAPWRTSKAFLEASTDKAMLQLVGEGDPSGCGQAFNMIKISMKGGFIGLKTPNATSAQAMEQLRKQNGGHQYNVKHQQEEYDKTIRDIWEKQKAALSNPIANEDYEPDRDEVVEDQQRYVAPTPRSMATPAAFDDSVSQFSVNSRAGKAMCIVRTVKNEETGVYEEVEEIIRDPRIWREYSRKRAELDEHLTE